MQVTSTGNGRSGRTGFVALLCLLLAFWACSAPVHAYIYKCVDHGGRVSFQGTTCDGMAPGNETVARLDNAWPAGGKHIFWEAKAASGGKIFLLGSLHFGAPWIYPLPAVINDALAAADALAVEVNILETPPEELAARMQRAGMYTHQAGLKGVLAPTEWEALANVSRTFGLPTALVERQQPWLASMTLTVAVLQQLGYSAAHGVDLHIMREAGRRMPIIELESADYQIELLSSMEPKDQVALLMQTLHEIDDAGRHFGDMLDAWLNGNAEKLDRVLFEGFDRMVRGEPLYQRLILDRNVQMTDAIVRLSRKHDVTFVVVGAGHLVGPGGIIERLKAAGYYVEQI
ncbi:MAG: TraB/GumN family protein [Bradyrhizobium sp.]|uniref:TraB/GumN family protein n=1 Tax=Bradyrhizobium sp. TaxID=376 RepID=UPI003D09911C